VEELPIARDIRLHAYRSVSPGDGCAARAAPPVLRATRHTRTAGTLRGIHNDASLVGCYNNICLPLPVNNTDLFKTNNNNVVFTMPNVRVYRLDNASGDYI